MVQYLTEGCRRLKVHSSEVYTWLDGILASLMTQMIKNLPAMQETRVRSLGQENALEKGMATHSGILVWRIPWTEEPDGLYVVHGVAKSQTRVTTSTFNYFHLEFSYPDVMPLQY